ncbi:MAG: cupin fold metalloprotein, WbuC family [Gammaproteobacteria bacterium]|nr:cupin fold metalloprotein, WbuC family [Gammaproteobacteria bacterium]
MIHESHDEPVQRMLIAIQPGTYFLPHRHSTSPKWKLMMVLKGAAAWIGFDEQGRVSGRMEAGAHRAAKGLEYPPRTWHALVCLALDTVLLECKPGPFAPIPPEDYVPWAPEEGAADASGFVRCLTSAKPGECFGGSDTH